MDYLKKLLRKREIEYQKAQKTFLAEKKLRETRERKRIKNDIYKINFTNFNEQAYWQSNQKILQFIFDCLDNKTKNAQISIDLLIPENQSAGEIDNLFDKLTKRKIFQDWYRDKENYYILSINKRNFEAEQNEVAKIVSKFSDSFKIFSNKQTENQKIISEPKNSQPVIKLKSLELIAREIGDMDSGSNLIEFLTNCGIKRELIEYPQTKWRMIYAVLTTLATSSKPQDQETLCKVIEEAVHPLMHKGDEKIAKQYENKFNNLLKYNSFVLKNGKLKKNDQQSEQGDEDEDDIFSYDDGISSPYENTDLELFILKKILLEHKPRDDGGFSAKEFSFNNNSLGEICRTIHKLMEDKILYLSANTRPERFENEEGIEDKDGFINWKMVEKLDKNPKEMNTENNCVIFDTDVVDEIKLKGRIDIAIEEFMNDKIYNGLGYLINKEDVEKEVKNIQQMKIDKEETRKIIYDTIIPQKITYLYEKQREIIIEEITKNNEKELALSLNNFRDKQVDVLKTLLALEKENLLRIKELESNQIYDEKGNFVGKWSKKDNPVAKIQVLKIYPHKQEPLHIVIDEVKKDIGIRDFIAKTNQDNKSKFPYKLPAGTKWENFTITFLDDENVFIQVKQFNHNASYKDMGFIGKGNNNPSEAWTFLRVLARVNGELAPKDPESRDKYKKQKELLAKTLQDYFTLEYDPFYPYQRNESYKSYDPKTRQKSFYSTKEMKSYRIKIILVPPPQVDNKKSNTEEEKDDLGLKEYFDEQAPEMDDSETHF